MANWGRHSATADPNLKCNWGNGRGAGCIFQLHVASYVGLVMPCNERTASFPAPGISWIKLSWIKLWTLHYKLCSLWEVAQKVGKKSHLNKYQGRQEEKRKLRVVPSSMSLGASCQASEDSGLSKINNGSQVSGWCLSIFLPLHNPQGSPPKTIRLVFSCSHRQEM